MTLKTDLKFGFLLIAILGGIYFFVTKTGPPHITMSEMESQLRRKMTHAELSKILAQVHGKVTWVFDSHVEFSVYKAGSGMGPNDRPVGTYQFEFDALGRLKEADKYMGTYGVAGDLIVFSPLPIK